MVPGKYPFARAAFLLVLLALLCVPILPGDAHFPTPGAAAAAAEWSKPINISQSGEYDTTPGVAATSNGSVTIAWERRILPNPSSNYILAAAAVGRDAPFSNRPQLSHTNGQKSSGSVRVRADSLGRRHFVWWQYDGSAVCDYYARMEADGSVAINEKVPGTCGLGMKNTALTVGPGNSVHALFGKNLQTLLYWQRTDAGWVVQSERLTGAVQPEHLTIGVTTGGVVIAAWKGLAAKDTTDVYVATRRGSNNWTVEDVSSTLSPLCVGFSYTYFPVLAADYSGGMRLAWVDQRCPSHGDGAWPGDVYYREWNPASGWASPPVMVQGGLGDAWQTTIVVDTADVAHIIWVNQAGYSIFYASGRGTQFSKATNPPLVTALGGITKDVDASYGGGAIHLVFTSDRNDPLKEVYYTYLPVSAPPAPNPPPPPPAPTPTAPPLSVPGSGSVTFPETGKTMTGVFLSYWTAHGSLPQQGFPVSNLVAEVSPLNGKSYVMQYTERAVFEYHPENQAPYDVLLSQVGRFRYKEKYQNGAPGQVPNTLPGSVLVPETGKRLGGIFLDYWNTHGGLMQQGYPISDEFTEVSDLDHKPYKVQYFERAVFEWHPEYQPPYDVLLSLLGVFQYRGKYGR